MQCRVVFELAMPVKLVQSGIDEMHLWPRAISVALSPWVVTRVLCHQTWTRFRDQHNLRYVLYRSPRQSVLSKSSEIPIVLLVLRLKVRRPHMKEL